MESWGTRSELSLRPAWATKSHRVGGEKQYAILQITREIQEYQAHKGPSFYNIQILDVLYQTLAWIKRCGIMGNNLPLSSQEDA